VATYAAAVAYTSPARYYKLDSNGNDSGSDGTALTFGASTAAPTLNASGGSDGSGSASFDGINDYAYAPSVAWGTNAITVSVWFFSSAFSSTQVWFESSANYNSTTGRSFLIYSDATNLQAGMFSGTGSGSVYDSVTFPLPATGAFAHCVFIFDASASTTNRILFYKNAAAQTQSGASWQSGTGSFQTNDMYVMARGAGTLPQAAQIDDVAVWKRRLSTTEISNLYNSVVPGGASYPPASRKAICGLSFR